MRGRKPKYTNPKQILQHHIREYYKQREEQRPGTDKEKIAIAEEIITHYKKELKIKGWDTEESNEALKAVLNNLTSLWSKQKEEEEKKKRLEEWKKNILPVKSRENFR